MFRSSPVARSLLAVAFLAPVAAAGDPPAEAVRWRTDYNAARQEAKDKGLPILLDIGTEDCFYCRKLDATTLKDPAVAALLAGQFVAIKVDGHREAGLARALNVTMYPTLVLAGPDGKIHQTLAGYQTADQLTAHLRQSVTTATAELVVKAATGGGVPPALGDKTNLTRAREVLSLAKDEFHGERYASCLEHCDYLAAVYADQPEGKEAATLVARIKSDPVRLSAATDQANEKAANLQLVLADAYKKRGNDADAAACFEKVMKLAPNGKSAEYARAELSRLRK